MNKEFFGSKLNTVLLIVLIVLMIVALKVMFKDKEKYLRPFTQNKEQVGDNDVVYPQVSPNQADLVSLSITPNQTLSGLVNFTGSVKNAYFFEANIVIRILDVNNNVLKTGFGTATTDWMTTNPVSFQGSIDLTGLPTGPAYFQIHNDNASGLPQNDKFILIPIVIQ